MSVILSQHIDKVSDYDDIPFSIYHFPKRYKNQVQIGDMFLYYQGDRSKKENRYYFGVGVIGTIEASTDGNDYYAQIVNGLPFLKKVPIYNPDGGYFESLDFGKVRNKETPPWLSSIRPISNRAFNSIIELSGISLSSLDTMAVIEKQNDPLLALLMLNERYKDYTPQKRERLINAHVDRGTVVTKSLKKILGANCQICGTEGFLKPNGDRYVEAHHLSQLAFEITDSLCSDNVILVCPNCHRELHYGGQILVENRGKYIYISLSIKENTIRRNTTEYLRNFLTLSDSFT